MEKRVEREEERDRKTGFERDTNKTSDMTFQCTMVARKNLITSCGALGHGQERLYNPAHVVLLRP